VQDAKLAIMELAKAKTIMIFFIIWFRVKLDLHPFAKLNK
jgi:hypothetical protein